MPVRMMIGGDLLRPGEPKQDMPNPQDYRTYGTWYVWDGSDKQAMELIILAQDELLDIADRNGWHVRGIKTVGRRPAPQQYEDDRGFIAAKMYFLTEVP